MKRSLILMAVLSLATVLLFSSQGSAQTSGQPALERGSPLQVTISVTPRRDRTLPYTFTTTGRIVLPPLYCAPGQSPAPFGPINCIPILCPPGATDERYCLIPGPLVLCSGTVTVRVQRFTTTISARNVAVRPDCTYRSRVSFHLRLPTRTGSLRVRSRFQGNVVLLPRNSATRTVRAG